MTRIAVFNGSPHGSEGNTHYIVREFLKGAEKAGAVVENHFLVEKRISHCKACLRCWTETPGTCVVKDDMQDLTERFMEADIVVMATPVHVDGVSGLLKNFMDRLIPIVDPHFERDPDGESRHVKRYDRYPKIVVISNCGLPEMSHFQAISHHMKRMARNVHSEVIGEIYRSHGPILTYPNPMVEPMRIKYRRLLRKAGKHVVEKGRLSDDLKKKLEVAIVPENMYFDGANREFDKALKKIGK